MGNKKEFIIIIISFLFLLFLFFEKETIWSNNLNSGELLKEVAFNSGKVNFRLINKNSKKVENIIINPAESFKTALYSFFYHTYSHNYLNKYKQAAEISFTDLETDRIHKHWVFKDKNNINKLLSKYDPITVEYISDYKEKRFLVKKSKRAFFYFIPYIFLLFFYFLIILLRHNENKTFRIH